MGSASRAQSRAGKDMGGGAKRINCTSIETQLQGTHMGFAKPSLKQECDGDRECIRKGQHMGKGLRESEWAHCPVRGLTSFLSGLQSL